MTHAERMWYERPFTDAEIITATGSIKVHRSILCASPPFEAAFEGGYAEGNLSPALATQSCGEWSCGDLAAWQCERSALFG